MKLLSTVSSQVLSISKDNLWVTCSSIWPLFTDKFFFPSLVFRQNFLGFKLCTLLLVLSVGTTEKSCSLSSLFPSIRYLYIHLRLLLFKLSNTRSLQPLYERCSSPLIIFIALHGLVYCVQGKKKVIHLTELFAMRFIIQAKLPTEEYVPSHLHVLSVSINFRWWCKIYWGHCSPSEGATPSAKNELFRFKETQISKELSPVLNLFHLISFIV